MKSGIRGCGIAFSDGRTASSVAAAVVRADRVVDGLRFAGCSVGGLDATRTVIDLLAGLDRPDVRYLFLAGVAPAWFNLLDVRAIHEATTLPVVAVSFEASEGLDDAIDEHFSGEERAARHAVYESLPVRERIRIENDGGDESDEGDGTDLFVRSVGFDDGGPAPTRVVRTFTPEGGRPEPLRVARVAARANREYVDAAATDDATVGDASANDATTADDTSTGDSTATDDGERRR